MLVIKGGAVTYLEERSLLERGVPSCGVFGISSGAVEVWGRYSQPEEAADMKDSRSEPSCSSLAGSGGRKLLRRGMERVASAKSLLGYP